MHYPVAETFESVQGEGCWTGTQMHFVRLAGCNVGVYPEGSTKINSVCTNCFGEKFICDTDYRKTETLSIEEILGRSSLSHICITGGEPFIHDLEPLIQEFKGMVHIETSGTKPIPRMLHWQQQVWITCSPKWNCLFENTAVVNEWKFVVGSPADLEKVAAFLYEHPSSAHVFVQPIASITEPNVPAARELMQELKAYPEWRLSVQMHKFLGVR